MEEVIGVRVEGPYVLEIVFSDGKGGLIDLSEQIYGEVFEPLRDPDYFRLAGIEGSTVAWPNGADFSPEFLYDAVQHVSGVLGLQEQERK